MQQDPHSILIVTGMSGAGRSTVANALEDAGWYVVDNLPPALIPHLVELVERTGADQTTRVAAVVDVRGGKLFRDLQQALDQVRDGHDTHVVFLDASDDVLVRRFEQVRRPHPLQDGGTLLDGISRERALLKEFRQSSDSIIDTSDLNIHGLTTRIHERFATDGSVATRLTVMSFGFKYGAPTDADMVADMRFLPNPFWVPELRSLTGGDEAVADYVFEQPGADEFITDYLRVLNLVIDGYQRENKRFATFAFGCTGGKHRSVATAERVAAALRKRGDVAVSVSHRDLGRE